MAKEFLDVLDDIKESNNSIQKAFNKSDGKGVRKLTAAYRNTPEYINKLTEAVDFVTEVARGKRPMSHLKEAMTTSDFPYLFGDILDRQLLAGYKEYPTNYQQFARIGTVPDFRTVNRFAVDGGEGTLDEVEEKENYKYGSLSESRYQYAVKKYGRKFDFSFEAMINDDLDAFSSMPERLGKSARRTEEKFATNLFVGTSGPDGTFFASGNSNIVTSNPTLSVAALQTAMQILAAQVDEDGEPIVVTAVTLAVPPALEITALNILNAIHIEALTSGGGTSAQTIRANNWMKNRVKLVVLPYHPIIATSANGDTSWYLFANPKESRPALEVGFLKGYTEPQVFMKASNTVSIGGGSVNPFDGDFDSDDIEYKVRHIIGGVLLDPKAAVASNGSGS